MAQYPNPLKFNISDYMNFEIAKYTKLTKTLEKANNYLITNEEIKKLE